MSHDERSGATTVSHLEAVDVGGPERVASLLERAMRQRAVGATALNEHSSRSHMVFMLAISGTHAASGQSVSGEAAAAYLILVSPAALCARISDPENHDCACP